MRLGRNPIPACLRLLPLSLCLLAVVYAPAFGDNDNPAGKLQLLDISIGPHPISPANMDGALDVVALDARFALRLTDGPGSLEETGAESNEKQFIVEGESLILSPDGQSAVQVLERSDRLSTTRFIPRITNPAAVMRPPSDVVWSAHQYGSVTRYPASNFGTTTSYPYRPWRGISR